MADYCGRESHVAVFGETITSSRSQSINSHFYWGVNPLEINLSTTNNGVAGQSVNMLQVGVSASGTSTAVATSKDRIYYKPSHDAYAMFTARWDAPDGVFGDTGRLIAGPIDSSSGYAICCDKLGLALLRRVGGVDTDIVRPVDFSLDPLDGSGPSGFEIDLNTINIFRITYGYLGIAPAIMEIYGGFFTGWIPFHTFDAVNTFPSLILDFPFLPIEFRADGDFNGAAYLYSGSWAGGIIGAAAEPAQHRYFAAESFREDIGLSLVNLLTIRPKALFRGKTNHIPIEVQKITAASQNVIGQALTEVSVYRNATLIGTPVWTSANDNSSVEYDNSILALTPGDFLDGFTVPDTSPVVLGVNELGRLGARPGESLTIAADTQANLSDTSLTIRWKELV